MTVLMTAPQVVGPHAFQNTACAGVFARVWPSRSICRRDIRRIRRLGFGHQFGDFGFQLRLDLTRVLV